MQNNCKDGYVWDKDAGLVCSPERKVVDECKKVIQAAFLEDSSIHIQARIEKALDSLYMGEA